MKIDLTEEELILLERDLSRQIDVLKGVYFSGSEGEKIQSDIDAFLPIMKNILDKIRGGMNECAGSDRKNNTK